VAPSGTETGTWSYQQARREVQPNDVIGSGATAVTLVPSLAESAAHVTMLQRSPTYVASRPASDAIADRLRA
jgi:thioredoxin reductase